jgi:hypothetical protein
MSAHYHERQHEMESAQLAVNSYQAALPAGDNVQQFKQVLENYKSDWLRIPSHQRDADAWDLDKRRKYVERLRQSATGAHPPGSFATYQIVTPTTISPIFLNDGYQRLTALSQLADHPELYGMHTDAVEQLLRQNISVQHRHYPDHDAAMRDFQLINNGTRLTPNELCRGFLQYMPGYEERWRGLLDHVAEIVSRSEARLCSRGKTPSRTEKHKRQRHTLALFYRFLVEEQGAVHYQDVPASDVQRFVDKGDVIELRLRSALLERDYDAVSSARERFSRFVDDETALLQKLMREVLGDGVGLAPVTHRYLLDLAVWRRHNKNPRAEYEAFVKVLLRNTGGQGQWRYEENGIPKGQNLSLCHLGLLPLLAELAGMPAFCEKQRRVRHREQLQPGWEQSHIDPFVSNGNGETFPEPGVTNRARGAKPVNRTDLGEHDG